MNKVCGRIALKESGIGIPDLLVVIYDLDPNTKPEELLGASAGGATPVGVAPPMGEQVLGDRLGSAVTDATGAFELTYEDEEFRIRNPQERRPDLHLTVLAPEEPGRDATSRTLYTSPAIRQNAGRTEQYLIRLTVDQLEKAGVPPPTQPLGEREEPQVVVQRLVQADRRLEAIGDAFRLMDKERVEQVRRTAGGFQATLKPALRRVLSRVSETLVDPESFVAPGESVAAKSHARIKRSIQEVINNPDPSVRAPATGLVALTDDQRQAIAARLGTGGAIAAEDLRQILDSDGSQRTRPSVFVREDPLVQVCREQSHDEVHCSSALGVDASSGGDAPIPPAPPHAPGNGGDIPGSGVEAITEQDINRFVARLMDTMTTPEEQVVYGLQPVATRDEVNRNLGDLAFPPSPADTDAFYDFHHLQIAFEPVWQEAIDEGLLDLAQDAYHDIVELGGNPDGDGGGPDRTPIRALLEEGRIVLTSRRVVRDHRGETIERRRRGAVVVRDAQGRTLMRDDAGGDSSVRIPARAADLQPGVPTLPAHPAERLPEVLAEMEERLREDYAFTIFAANRKERSVNFGVLVTYRQRWEPQAYQAGRLAKTTTLAPKQTQRYNTKTVLHRKRAKKEVENNLRVRRDEASQTSREEQEIIRKATANTNFTLTADGSYNTGVYNAHATTTLSREAGRQSEDVKKAFHEAVLKAAQESKHEHTTEVNTEVSEETEVTESGEITNPNDEIAVTFLFYELQRRYRVTERIHMVRPVIFVAQEVPRPDEIDEDWLLANDWILRRALLDDSFIPALDLVAHSVVGERVALTEMGQRIDDQRRVLVGLQTELAAVRQRLAADRAIFEEAIRDQWKFSTRDLLLQAMQRTIDQEREVLQRRDRELATLAALNEVHAKAYAEYLNHRTEIARVREQVKQNILHYMQAVWMHEPPDQRFFRLHNVAVPVLEGPRAYMFRNLNPVRSSPAGIPHVRLSLTADPPKDLYEFELQTTVNANLRMTTLAQVADLDNLLGFKGNYMIFPLREANALTEFMMQPYVVEGLDEVVDPDALGNWTLEEFAKYVCCLKENLSAADFAALRDQLKAQYQQLLSAPHRSGDIITVPTNSLFIEALPARHSLIEEFKARHRAIDVKKVQAEVRKAELENIRAAARLLGAKEHPALLEDPDVEKKIIIEGGGESVIVPAGDG